MNKLKLDSTVVISLGGSIVFPDEINWQYLRKFSRFVRSHLRTKRFVLVAGGGRLARVYQDAAQKVLGKISDEDKDWLGIHATRSNAHLLRTIFEDVADPVVIDERHKRDRLTHKVTIASGWRPGWSTDYIAVVLAYDFKAHVAVMAGKPDFVYDRDPAKNKDAKKLQNLTWAKYRSLIPEGWTPGFSSPVDPVAARFCHENNIKAIVLDGRKLKNFSDLVAGRPFRGSVIQDEK